MTWPMTSALSCSGNLESASDPLFYGVQDYSSHLSTRSPRTRFRGTGQVRVFFFFYHGNSRDALSGQHGLFFSSQFCSLASLISGQPVSDLWNYYYENKHESLGWERGGKLDSYLGTFPASNAWVSEPTSESRVAETQVTLSLSPAAHLEGPPNPTC